MNATRGKKRYKQKKRWYLPFFVCLLFVIMGTQIFNLYQKKARYQEREANLLQELDNEQRRSEELEAYEAYTQTDEYIVNTAHTKLGLVNDNEIVFKEK